MRNVLACAVCVTMAGCGSTSTPPAGSEIKGCDDAKLLASPSDLAQRGAWAVGAKTVTIDGLRTEVWYPTAKTAVEGMAAAKYDIRLALPPSEAAKIPDDANPWQTCVCVRDAPLDTTHGPYPVIVFVHGTA